MRFAPSRFPAFALLLLGGIVGASLLPGTASASRWENLQTEHFTVFYKPGDEARARRLLGALERGRPGVERLTGTSAGHIPVVIQDMGRLVNSMTDPLNEVIQLFPTPPSCRDDLSCEDWFLTVGTHEYVHILNMRESGGLPGLARTVLGTGANANLLNPPWSIEGIAVYGESRGQTRVGRLNDGTFADIAGALSGDPNGITLSVATHTPLRWPGGLHYIAGGLFHGYLAKTYGEERLRSFYADHSSRVFQWLSPVFPALGMDRAAKAAFGASIPSLWRQWRRVVAESAPANGSERVRLTRRGWDLSGLQIVMGKAYYQAQRTDVTGARASFDAHEIIERDLETGRERTLVSVTAPFIGPIRIHRGHLFFATREYGRGFPNTAHVGFLEKLWDFGLAKKKLRPLTVGEFRAFEAFPDGSLLLTYDRKDAFGSRLVRWNPGNVPVTLSVSDLLVDELLTDGTRTVATARRDGGSYGLYRLDTESGRLKAFLDGPWTERAEGLYGDSLMFTSNQGGAWGIYDYHFRSKKTRRLALGGHAIDGALDAGTGGWYGLGLNQDGYDLYRYGGPPAAASFPTSTAIAPLPDDLPENLTRRGGYGDNLSRLAPRILHAPFGVWGAGERFWGFAVSGGDAVYDFPAYVLALGRDEARRRMIGEAAVTSAYFAPLALAGQYQSLLGEEGFAAVALYPLYLGLSPGLSTLWLGGSGYGYDDMRRREGDPTLQASFAWPGFEANARVTLPIERKSWGSELDRNAFYGSARFRWKAPLGQVAWSGTWVEDLKNVDNPFGSLPGYSRDLNDRKGGMLYGEYEVPVWKIRRGLWNPCVFADILSLAPFAEGAWGRRGDSQVAYGARMALSGSLTTAALPVDLGARWARTREGNEEWEVSMTFNLPLMLGGSWKTPGFQAPLGKELQGPPGRFMRRTDGVEALRP